MLLDPRHTIVVGGFQVEVHHLFHHGALTAGDALIEQ